MPLSPARALEKIEKGNLSPVYVLVGAELYWRDRICSALRRMTGVTAGDMGLAEFDLRQDSVVDVLDKARSLNLLSPRQLLFIKNAQILLTRRGRDAEAAEKPASPRSDELGAYLSDPNPSSTLVFEVMDVDLQSDDWREKEKAKSRLETLERTFHAASEIVLLVPPGFEEAMRLVQQAVAERGRKISRQAAEQLVSSFHNNMAVLHLELEKALLFRPEKDVLEAADLAEVATGVAAESNPEFTQAIGARDARRTLSALDAMRRTGTYPPLVISEIARYLRQLIILRQSNVRDPRQAAKVLWDAKLPAPQSLLLDIVRQARNFTGTELLRGLQLAFQTDLALRSGPPDELLLLERFALALISREPVSWS